MRHVEHADAILQARHIVLVFECNHAVVFIAYDRAPPSPNSRPHLTKNLRHEEYNHPLCRLGPIRHRQLLAGDVRFPVSDRSSLCAGGQGVGAFKSWLHEQLSVRTADCR